MIHIIKCPQEENNIYRWYHDRMDTVVLCFLFSMLKLGIDPNKVTIDSVDSTYDSFAKYEPRG